jgi:hypothetical protein
MHDETIRELAREIAHSSTVNNRKDGTVRYLAGVVMGTMLFATDPVQVGTGTAIDPFVIFGTETVKLAWDVQTTPIEKAEIEVAKGVTPFDAVQTISVTRTGQELPWTTVDGVERIAVYTVMTALPDGLYRFRARVATVASVWSDWTDWKYAQKTWAKPEKPGGCTFLFR